MTELSKNEQSQKKRTLLEKKFTPHGSETTSLHQLDEFNEVSLENLVEQEKDDIIELDETSLKDFNVKEFNVKDFNVRTNEKRNDLESYTFNVKERNAMIIEINDKKFYIIFAQFKQQQKEMDRNTVETIIMRTDQSKHCTSFDVAYVACEARWLERMAKMAYLMGMFLPCLYLQFQSKEFVQQFEESKTLYDTVKSGFYSLIIVECQKGMQHHVVTNECMQTVPDLSDSQKHRVCPHDAVHGSRRHCDQNVSETTQSQSEISTYRRPELVNCTIET